MKQSGSKCHGGSHHDVDIIALPTSHGCQMHSIQAQLKIFTFKKQTNKQKAGVGTQNRVGWVMITNNFLVIGLTCIQLLYKWKTC